MSVRLVLLDAAALPGPRERALGATGLPILPAAGDRADRAPGVSLGAGWPPTVVAGPLDSLEQARRGGSGGLAGWAAGWRAVDGPDAGAWAEAFLAVVAQRGVRPDEVLVVSPTAGGALVAARVLGMWTAGLADETGFGPVGVGEWDRAHYTLSSPEAIPDVLMDLERGVESAAVQAGEGDAGDGDVEPLGGIRGS